MKTVLVDFAHDGHAMVESLLEMALRRVTEGCLIVARQRKIIAAHNDAGHKTDQHVRLLDTFEITLQIFGEHERQLRGAKPLTQ